MSMQSKKAMTVIILFAGAIFLYKNLQADDFSLPLKGYYIVVDKENFMFYLYEGNKIVLKTICCTGKRAGNKKREGDERTPEGRYKIEKIEKRNKYESLYHTFGAYFLKISYPNPVDNSLKMNPGSGIGIHSSKKYSEYRSRRTLGCVTIPEPKLLNLLNYVEEGTPVFIYAHLPVPQKPREQIEDFLTEWKKARETKNPRRLYDCYSYTYSPEMLIYKDLPSYGERDINIIFKNVKKEPTRHSINGLYPEEAMVNFREYYSSSLYPSLTKNKTLILDNQFGYWKIREERILR